MSLVLINVKELSQALEVWVDDVLVGYADCIITDNHGEWYGVIMDKNEFAKLADDDGTAGSNANTDNEPRWR